MTSLPAWRAARLRACLLVLCVCGAALSADVLAAAPKADAQAPGFYRMTLGDLEVTALSDGTHPFPVDTVVQGVSKADIQRDLERAFLQPPVQGSINAFLINTGSKLVLVDDVRA